jgi:hypothetical protein
MPRHAVIAIGAALLAVAFVVVELRMDDAWANGVLFLVAAVPAAALLAAGLREPPLGDRPRAGASALLLGGLAVFAFADFRLLQLLGRDDAFDAPRSLTVFFVLLTAVALLAAARSRSAACLLVGAIAFGGTVLAAVRWIFDTENIASYRPALLVLAVLFAAAAWAIRARPRHRDVLVDAAGLSILVLAQLGGGLFFGFGEGLPDFWEAVVLAGALALVLYAAVTRAPGPGLLALLLLAAFAGLVGFNERGIVEEDDPGDASLVGWPLVLLAGGLAALAYGLTRRGDDHGPPPPRREDPGDVTREVRV